MKGKHFAIGLLVFVFISCGQSPDKRTQLDKLKKDRDKITEQIRLIESELASEGNPVGLGEIKNVSVEKIKMSEFRHFIEVQGSVDGDQNIAVTPQMAGVVTSILVREGDAVRKNQVMAELDNKVMLQNLEQLKTQYNLVSDLYERQKKLWDKKIGSEVQYITAKNNKESVEESIKVLENQIDMTRIKSPIDGTVEEIPIRIGQLASPGYPAIRVVNFSKVKVIAELAEAYAPKVSKGDHVIVYFPDADKEVDAKLDFVSKFINPVNRTFKVEIHLNGGIMDFKANMMNVVKINDYYVKETIVIPLNLVQKSFDKSFVYVAAEEQGKMIVRKRDIIPGINYNGQLEVLSGLSENDKLITFGYQGLTEGQQVSY